MKKRHTMILLALIGIPGVLSGCLTEQPAPGTAEERIVVAIDQAPRSFDPRFTIDSTSIRISRLIFSSLVTVDNPALEPNVHIAERIEEDSTTPLIWHVRVKKGLTFHDGSPLDGKDIAYTYNSILDPTLGSPYRGDFSSKFRKVEVNPSNPYHVLFHIKRPYATFRTDLVLGIVPHTLGKMPEQKFPEGKVNGSGPYALEQVIPDRMVNLRRSATYHETVGGPEWLVFRVIRDENTRILSLLGGSSDLSINGVSPVLRDVIGERPELTVQTRSGIGFTYLGLNLRHPHLANAKVRKALSLSIDRNAIIRDRFMGGAQLATSMLPSFHWAFRETPDSSLFNPKRAEALLDEAGLYKDPKSGIRFSLDFKISSNRFRIGIARLLVRQWRAIGIEVKLRAYEFSTFFADVRKGAFDLFLLQLPEPIEPDMYRWMLYSLSTPHKNADPQGTTLARLDRRNFVPGMDTLRNDPQCATWHHEAATEGWFRWTSRWLGASPSTGTGNRTFYANPRFDCLVELGQWETDLEKRKDIYGEIQEILANDLPVIPLWHEDQVAYMHPKIKGFELLPTSQFTPLLHVNISE